jgi:hypothetical protein
MVGLVTKTIQAHQRKGIHRLKGIYKTVQIKEGDPILGVVQQMVGSPLLSPPHTLMLRLRG